MEGVTVVVRESTGPITVMVAVQLSGYSDFDEACDYDSNFDC